MKTHLHISALLLSSIIACSGAIVWTGAGANNNIFTNGNWNFEDSPLNSFSAGVQIQDDVIITNPAGSIGVANEFYLGRDRTFTATNTTITTSGSAGVFRGFETGGGEQAVFNLINSSVTLNRVGNSATVYLDATSTLNLNQTGGNGINNNSVVYLAPGATITFVNGSESSLAIAQRIINPFTGVSFFEDYYVGANGTPSNAGELNDPLYAGQGSQTSFVLTGLDSTPFGATDGSNPIGTFTITAIPEPGAFGLSLVGVSLLLLQRRQRRAV